MEEGRSAFKILAVKPTGKRPLGRSNHSLGYNIRINRKEIDVNRSDWIDSALVRDYRRTLVELLGPISYEVNWFVTGALFTS